LTERGRITRFRATIACPRRSADGRNTVFENKSQSVMKVRNSLKSLRGRHRNNQLVRRRGRVYVINKTQRRFKARQG